MSTNILQAIENIIKDPVLELRSFYQGRNRANIMGDALETYVKDVFANTVNSTIEQDILAKYNECFSYTGNQNNPPDIIIKNGDAIEVKKIESILSGLALNSSYPKAKLYSNSHMITNACKNCEVWDVKDIIYAVGVVNESVLKSLCFVYGIDYAASSEIYERVGQAVKDGILTIPEIEFSDTKELGRVNRVDPLGITYLRIRGMWHIQNPIKVFDYIYRINHQQSFNFMALINDDKYDSFELEQRIRFESVVSSVTGAQLVNVRIKSPDNPAQLVNAKFITFSI